MLPLTLISLVDNVYGNLDGRGSCSVPQRLDPGETYTCSFIASFFGSDGDSVTDIVTGRGQDDNGNIVEDSDDATVNLREQPEEPELPCDADLIIRKYHDRNGNARQDAGEPYLEGWIFRITVSGQTFDIVTDQVGTAALGGLKGSQTVTVEERLDLVPDSSWLSTTGNPIQVTLACGENTLRFGNAKGKLPPTGLGGAARQHPGAVSLAVLTAGLAAIYLILLVAAHSLALAGAGTRLAVRTQGVGWLLAPLILGAAAVRWLRHRRS